MWKVTTFMCSLICFIETRNISQNDTAVLISKYSKVARWGVVENDTSKTQQGRSSSGQSLWTHRSDANIIAGQSIKTAPYRFSLKASTKVDDRKVEKIPAVGEVVQDRYNPRPYFAYGQIPSKANTATYAPPKQKAAPAPSATPSAGNEFDSFPAVFNVAPSTPQSIDLYTSPYSSYNPPPLKQDDTPISDPYPPTNQDYTPPGSMDNGGIDEYKPASVSPYVSLGPPLVYQPEDDDMTPNHPNHDVDAPPSDHMTSHVDDGPPRYPPKSEDDVYYPPNIHGNGNNFILDHPPEDYKSSNVDMSSNMGMNPDMNMGLNTNMNSDMTMDLAPPLSNGHSPHFPQYLYDSHHYDNHVYEEVPHTTTMGTEDKRVSSGHYSYYYLGRKLWYIPLYFSIYFIIYVTVLILKAIARHKIQYKHKWVASGRNGGNMEMNPSDSINELHGRVNSAIDKAQKIYATFAM